MNNKLLVVISLVLALCLTMVLVMCNISDSGSSHVNNKNSDTTSEISDKATHESVSADDIFNEKTEQHEHSADNSKSEQSESDKKESDSTEHKEEKLVALKNYDDYMTALFGKDAFEGFEIVNVEPLPSFEIARVSFVACGDNLVHSSVYTDAQNLAKGTEKDYNFLPMYENVTDIIQGADVAFINQETPFGGDVKPISGYPMFNTPDRMGYDIKELGFDVVGLANNHMLDSYAAGYERTIEFWENMDGVLGVGGFRDKDDYENIRILEKNGIKIAFLAYTYGTNGLTLPSGSKLVVPYYNDSDIDRQTKAARKIADCVIVSIHWGTEDHFAPGNEQKRKAQIMVDNGVDVILGHHPHVLQDLKWIDRPDGGKTLCIYSLGNFLSGMMYSRNMVGGFLGFDIIKDVTGTSVENAYFIPTISHYNKDVREFKIYRFSEYTSELEAVHGAHKFDNQMSMKYMRNIIDNEIPSEFLVEEFYHS